MYDTGYNGPVQFATPSEALCLSGYLSARTAGSSLARSISVKSLSRSSVLWHRIVIW